MARGLYGKELSNSISENDNCIEFNFNGKLVIDQNRMWKSYSHEKFLPSLNHC